MHKEQASNRRSQLGAVAFSVFVLLIIILPQAAAALRGGAATVNITAEKPAEPVHDPLYAKVLALEEGSNRVVIISLDIGQARQPLVEEVRRLVQQEVGIHPSRILVNASHNHDAYDGVAEDLAGRIVGAVKQASESMVPVRIGGGRGSEERITMNRRLRLKDGKHSTIRRSHPSPKNAEVIAVGPFDPQIGLLRVDTESGTPLALLYNFASHPYGGVPAGGITANLPVFASRVIGAAWPEAVALFVQGAAGDVTPVRYKDFDDPIPTEELGTKLGLSTLQAAQGISTNSQAVIRVYSEKVELPRRTDAEQRIQALLAEQEKILELFTSRGMHPEADSSLNFETFLPLYFRYLVNAEYPLRASYAYRQEAITNHKDLQRLDADNKQRIARYLERVENMDRLVTIRTNLRLLRRHLKEPDSGPILAEVQAMRIGDVVLVTFPGELSCEVGLRIKRQSPFPKTFVAAYSNGHIGYAPTAADYGKEAYEDSITHLAPQWQEIYERKALEMIGRLRQPGE